MTHECLAELARRALSEGRQASLLVASAGLVVSGAPALLHDDAGEPRFVCDAQSPIVAACGRSALLRLAAPPEVEARTSVMLSGRLTRLGADLNDPPDVVTVALPVQHVLVCRERAGAAPMQSVVPLEAYLRAEPDRLAACAEALVRHTNAGHQPQLRALVAGWTGVPTSGVADVSLAALDRHGARLDWIDVDGAHSVALRFPEPAQDSQSLSRLLREQLCLRRPRP